MAAPLLNGQPQSPSPYPHGTVLDHTGRPWREEYTDAFALPHVITFGGLLGQAWKAYWHGKFDEAQKHGRIDALAMEHDCGLMAMVNERKLAVASLPWHLEVPDEHDPVQVAVRDALTKAIEAIKGFRPLLMCLLDAVWYGRHAAQVRWKWTFADGLKVLTVRQWRPVRGDKIGHLWDGTPYVLVLPTAADTIPGAEVINTTAGGRGLVLRGAWRERFLLHKHEPVDADFLELQAAEAIHGVGVRSRVFFLDWLKREWLANIASYMERVGLGVELWYYDPSNARSKTETFEAARNQEGTRTRLLVPRWGGDRQPGYERIEVPMTGAQFLMGMIQHIEELQERYIIGQSMSASAEGGAGGLGNEAAALFQMDTKSQVRNYDAQNLAEQVLTGDEDEPGLVSLVQQWSFPETMPSEDNPRGFRVKFRFSLEAVESAEKLQAITVVVGTGLPVKVDEVYSTAGLTRPHPDDDVLMIPLAAPEGEPARKRRRGRPERYERDLSEPLVTAHLPGTMAAPAGDVAWQGDPSEETNRATAMRLASRAIASGEHQAEAVPGSTMGARPGHLFSADPHGRVVAWRVEGHAPGHYHVGAAARARGLEAIRAAHASAVERGHVYAHVRHTEETPGVRAMLHGAILGGNVEHDILSDYLEEHGHPHAARLRAHSSVLAALPHLAHRSGGAAPGGGLSQKRREGRPERYADEPRGAHEYTSTEYANLIAPPGRKLPSGDSIDPTGKAWARAKAEHVEHVRRALEAGKVVPPHVLAEYPGLARKQRPGRPVRYAGTHSGHGYTPEEVAAMSPGQRKILAARMGMRTAGKDDAEIHAALRPAEKPPTLPPAAVEPTRPVGLPTAAGPPEPVAAALPVAPRLPAAHHAAALEELRQAKLKGEQEGGRDPRGDLAHLPAGERLEAASSRIASAVQGHVKAKTVGPGVGELYAAAGGDLSDKEFRATLLHMHGQGTLRLGGWPRMLDDLPHPHVAPLVSGKVMGYVQAPQEKPKGPDREQRRGRPVRYAGEPPTLEPHEHDWLEKHHLAVHAVVNDQLLMANHAAVHDLVGRVGRSWMPKGRQINAASAGLMEDVAKHWHQEEHHLLPRNRERPSFPDLPQVARRVVETHFPRGRDTAEAAHDYLTKTGRGKTPEPPDWRPPEMTGEDFHAFGRGGRPLRYGRWITIGAKEDEGGTKRGGTPVYLEGGRITKGAPGLVGKKIDALKSDPWHKEARAAGVKPEHLHQLAGEMLAHDTASKASATRMLQEARKAYPHLRAISAQKARGLDADQVRGLDDIAHSFSARSEYQHLFAGHEGNPEERLFDLLVGGNPQPMSREDAYREALEHLHEHGRPVTVTHTDEDDYVPFRRRGLPLRFQEQERQRDPYGGGAVARPLARAGLTRDILDHYDHEFRKALRPLIAGARTPELREDLQNLHDHGLTTQKGTRQGFADYLAGAMLNKGMYKEKFDAPAVLGHLVANILSNTNKYNQPRKNALTHSELSGPGHQEALIKTYLDNAIRTVGSGRIKRVMAQGGGPRAVSIGQGRGEGSGLSEERLTGERPSGASRAAGADVAFLGHYPVHPDQEEGFAQRLREHEARTGHPLAELRAAMDRGEKYEETRARYGSHTYDQMRRHLDRHFEEHTGRSIEDVRADIEAATGQAMPGVRNKPRKNMSREEKESADLRQFTLLARRASLRQDGKSFSVGDLLQSVHPALRKEPPHDSQAGHANRLHEVLHNMLQQGHLREAGPGPEGGRRLDLGPNFGKR